MLLHTLHAAAKQFQTQALQLCTSYDGLTYILTTGLSINGCLHLSNQLDQRKQDWLILKFRQGQLQRFDMTQADWELPQGCALAEPEDPWLPNFCSRATKKS